MTRRSVRCILVDDERLARRHLARLLQAHRDFEICGEAANAAAAMERIADCEPDVVFLDIEMPGLNAFDMLAQISRPPLIVFATAFDEYAIRAFDANAIDYLLKPITIARPSFTGSPGGKEGTGRRGTRVASALAKNDPVMLS